MPNRVRDFLDNPALAISPLPDVHTAHEELYRLDVDELVRSISLPQFQQAPPHPSRNILIRSLRSEKYRLTDPLPVHLEEEDGHVTAIAFDIGQYGAGSSDDDAIADLCAALVEYYELLNSEAKLSHSLLGHRSFLNGIVEAIDAAEEARSSKNP